MSGNLIAGQALSGAAAARPGGEGGTAARRRRRFAAALLALLTFLVFSPSLFNGFVDFDDNFCLVENRVVRHGLTAEGLRWAFTSTELANWFPMTWLSHMLDVELFGLAAAGHHLTSLLLHTANGALLLLALHAATGSLWPSAGVAALFALHPLRVESVAWASERKDVLAVLFWMLTTSAYLRYVRRPGLARYGAVAALLALGFTAKPLLLKAVQSGSGC